MEREGTEEGPGLLRSVTFSPRPAPLMTVQRVSLGLDPALGFISLHDVTARRADNPTSHTMAVMHYAHRSDLRPCTHLVNTGPTQQLRQEL